MTEPRVIAPASVKGGLLQVNGAGDEPGRRGQIVRTATAVLARQGYSATSLKDVAREAGVAQGLLHYYFESKQELLLEVVSGMEREMTADWQAAGANIEGPLGRTLARAHATTP